MPEEPLRDPYGRTLDEARDEDRQRWIQAQSRRDSPGKATLAFLGFAIILPLLSVEAATEGEWVVAIVAGCNGVLCLACFVENIRGLLSKPD